MSTKKLLLTLFAFLIISWPSYSSATSGCCSWHGGVDYCDTSTGRQVCSDGSYSPSCGCEYIPPKATKSVVSSSIENYIKTKNLPDKTDYKKLSADLKSQLDTAQSDLQKSVESLKKSQSSEISKDNQINELEKSVSNRNFIIFLLAAGLVAAVFKILD